MLFVFVAWNNPSLFQTGWLVESILIQTLIIHIIRTAKIPFAQSRAGIVLAITTLTNCLIGVALPHTALGNVPGLRPFHGNTGLCWRPCSPCTRR